MKLIILSLVLLLSGCQVLSDAFMNADWSTPATPQATYSRPIRIDSIDLGNGMTQYTVH